LVVADYIYGFKGDLSKVPSHLQAKIK